MAHEIYELLWLQGLLTKLGFITQGPINLYCENKAEINITHNPVQYDKTKLIEVDKHFIKEKLQSGKNCTPFYEDWRSAIRSIHQGGLSDYNFSNDCRQARTE